MPCASRSSTQKRLSPESVRPNASAICDVVADVNHLTPLSLHVPSSSGTPTVLVRETSEPPERSVIHCPEVQNSAGSRDVRRL